MTFKSAQELREQISQGDERGLTYVFEQSHRYCVRGLVKNTGCDTEDAEDLFMDALLVFRENVLSGKLEKLSNLQSYMYGICLNLWRSLNRARTRWEKEQNEVERQLWLILGQEEDPWGGDDGEYVRRQIRTVTAALEKLGETCRKLLTYVYIEERPHREISQLLGLASAEVVKVTRHRCFQQWVKHIETTDVRSNGK
jgi:RNA polymerase sigma factor (sigma-70 family)